MVGKDELPNERVARKTGGIGLYVLNQIWEDRILGGWFSIRYYGSITVFPVDRISFLTEYQLNTLGDGKTSGICPIILYM